MYYKKALQNFAYSLYRFSDKEKAQQLLNEDSVEKIEKEIIVRKENISVEEFMFEAGVVVGTVLECADRDANVKHFFTLLGKMFFTSYGKEFFTYLGKQIFTSYGKYFFTLPGKQIFYIPVSPCGYRSGCFSR